MSSVVIDTSAWLSGIFWRGAPHRALQAWKSGHFEVMVSLAVLLEIEHKLAEKANEFGAELELVEEWTTLIAEEAILVEPIERIRACRDSSDDKFLEAAVAGQAEYVVSGNKDLTDMHRFRGIEIVTPRQLLESLSGVS